MQQSISVLPEPPAARDGHVERRALVRGHAEAPATLWFRVPAEQASLLSPSADPFLIGTLFLAMRRGRNLHVHGRVSPSLLASLDRFQAIWARWLPDEVRRVELTADELLEAPEAPARACLTFSGGLDSCFSAWRHRPHAATGVARHPLGAGLLVHGFDVPLASVDLFEQAAEAAQAILASIDVPLLRMSTNLRELVTPWHDTHGACLAACLHLLGGGFREGVVASSHSADTLRFPWGSNPLTDPLLSSDAFTLRYDAVEYDRMDKAWGIRDWTEAMTHLRVCFQRDREVLNCGRCVRCVGTALCFAAKGVEPPKALCVGPLVEALRRLRDTDVDPVALQRLSEMLHEARTSGRAREWGDALADFVRYQRRKRQRSRARKKVRKLGRRLAGALRGSFRPAPGVDAPRELRREPR